VEENARSPRLSRFKTPGVKVVQRVGKFGIAGASVLLEVESVLSKGTWKVVVVVGVVKIRTECSKCQRRETGGRAPEGFILQ
jgi:hypothetical protein